MSDIRRRRRTALRASQPWLTGLATLVALATFSAASFGFAESIPQEKLLRETATQENVTQKNVPHGMHVSLRHLGIGGAYKVGHWTPITLHVRGGAQATSGHFEVLAADSEGDLAIHSQSALPTTLAANADATITVYARFGRPDNELRVRWVPSDGQSATAQWNLGRLPNASPSVQQFVLVLGTDIDLSDTWPLVSRQATQPPRLIQVASADQLPQRWIGWDAIDVLVLTGGDVSQVSQLEPSQWTALERWIRLGGRMLFAAGAQAEELLGPSYPLSQWLPATFDRVAYQLDTTRLEAFAGAQDRLDLLLGNDGLAVARLEQVHGKVVVAEVVRGERLPMVVQSAAGLGQIVFVAFDLHPSQLAEWSGYPRMMAKLLQVAGVSTAVDRDDPLGGQLSHLGFKDLSGQLRAALELFPGVRLVAFGWIALLAVAYVLWIGPGDYWVLRRFGRQWHRTWITFPASILAITGLIFYLGRAGQGEAPEVNRVDLVDLDLQSGTWRGTAWAHIHAPAATALSVELDVKPAWQSPTEPAHCSLSWHGLPGDSFGGMDAVRRDRRQLAPYRLDWITAGDDTSKSHESAARATGATLPTGGTRSFRSRWWRFAPADPASSSMAARSSMAAPSLTATPAGYLEGAVGNPLPADLQDVKLLYGRWYYELDDLRPGERMELDEETRPRSLRNWLARREVVDGRDHATPWNQASVDVPRILEMLMFYDRAGGISYTGLTHQYQDWLDLSAQLAVGRAILVGRLKDAPTRWDWELGAASEPARDGQQWAFARVVIPVEAKGVQQFD